MTFVHRRFLHHRRLALLPFALYKELSAPVPFGVLNLKTGAAISRHGLNTPFQKNPSNRMPAVTRTRRFAAEFESYYATAFFAALFRSGS
jgi:hypothetical protein